jgi:hypothetical protein
MVLTGLLLSLATLASDYDKVVSRLQELDKLPNTALFTLGKNDQGTDLLGLVVGDATSARRRYVVVGTHHGNEKASATVPLLFIEKIAANVKADEVYFVVPVLNVSGYNVSRREETGADRHLHDSNRDYEDACATKQDFQLKSTSLIAELVERENIISAVTVHGYQGTFTFPWGTNAKDYRTLDDAFMSEWANKAVKINNYQTGTHGAVIYPAEGAFEDWAYFKLGVWSYLMEIKSPLSDLNKDALTLVEFFKSSPAERSKNVGQKVNCLGRILSQRSRP